MAAFSLNRKMLSPNLRAFLTPLAFLAVLTVVSVLTVRFGVARIQKQREDLTKAKKDVTVLGQKESVLRDVQSDIPGYAQTLAAVLPERNPSLTMITQLKNLGVQQGVTLGNFKVGSEISAQGALTSVDLSFGVEGAMGSVITFIDSITTLAPVSTLQKAKINESQGAARADVAIRLYFSAFPAKLPSLTEPQASLTGEEKETLTKLAGRTLPPYTNLPAQPGSPRENPFE